MTAPATAADWLEAWSTFAGVLVGLLGFGAALGNIWLLRREITTEREARQADVARLEAERLLTEEERASLVRVDPRYTFTKTGAGEELIGSVRFTVHNDSDRPVLHVTGQLYRCYPGGGRSLLGQAVSMALPRVPAQGAETLHFVPGVDTDYLCPMPPEDELGPLLFETEVEFTDIGGTRWCWNDGHPRRIRPGSRG